MLETANVTPIPKGPQSSSVANYRPIYITSVLSKVFERLVSVRLGPFMERSGVLPTTQFAYRKSLGTCDALLSVSHTLQIALERGQEARIVQIDFSAALITKSRTGNWQYASLTRCLTNYTNFIFKIKCIFPLILSLSIFFLFSFIMYNPVIVIGTNYFVL